MLLPTIALDAAMTVFDALKRLACHGVWRDPRHPAAEAWIAEYCRRVAAAGGTLSFDEAARRLSVDPDRMGVCVRRQWYDRVVWYARSADLVLDQLLARPGETTVLDGLDLHEEQSTPVIAPSDVESEPGLYGVVLERGLPVAVSLGEAGAATRSPHSGGGTSLAPPSRRGDSALPPPRRLRSLGGLPPAERVQVEYEVLPDSAQALQPELHAWPVLDAPAQVTARVPFEVVVGIAASQQAGTTGAQLTFPVDAGVKSVTLTVELIADGVDAPDGWTRPLEVFVDRPETARATFTLVARPPAGTQPVHLTLLEARYMFHGAVCGAASRPLEIRAAGYAPPQGLPQLGTPWTAQPALATAVTPCARDWVADLTVEIAKPDGNATAGRYVCRLYSPHPITAPRGPHDIDFGNDSKTFAKTIVDQVRMYAGDPIVDNTLRAMGGLVAEKLPDAAFDALEEIAKIVAPDPPTVLVVSGEPYVPWELALLDPPLDATRPPFLGAQTLLGRWLRECSADVVPPEAAPPAGSARVRLRKPPVDPPASIDVQHMAVMAGLYTSKSGLRSLPAAEDEADRLVKQYDAVALAASLQSLKQLLDARLEQGFKAIGAPGAVHFAGHGDYDPTSPDSSVMMLSDGRPLSSLLFRSASYGGAQQPVIFLNACMIGIGGELLGDMGGFPGNCLRGGFGAVLGALWEVDDVVAHDLALEFWNRVLPTSGTDAEPVAAVLRDLRARYASAAAPVPTYLAYVFYGHPKLKLGRIA